MRLRSPLLVFTHGLALAIGLAPGLWFRSSGISTVRAMLAMGVDGYSRQLASVAVGAGDDAAALSALRRHLERQARLRERLAAQGGSPRDLEVLTSCSTLSVVAALTPATAAGERDAIVAEAVARCPSLAQAHGRQWVLDTGARLLRIERETE